jgi:cryptochrome
VQKAAKCVIGMHYPKPMVHHTEASRLNIQRMTQIYQQLSCYRGLGEHRAQPAETTANSLKIRLESAIFWYLLK